MFQQPPAVICRLMLIAPLAMIAGSYAVLIPRFPAMLYLIYLPAAAVLWRACQRKPALWSHGTARLSWVLDLLRRGMLSAQGLVMGRVGSSQALSPGQAVQMLLDPRVPSDTACQAVLSVLYKRRWADERMIRVKDYVHLLTCAPSGAGKTVYVLGPNLLSQPNSCICTDPKGELWRLSSEHRKKRFRHRVFLLDPFGVCKAKSDGFNPLDFIDASSPDFLSRCKDLANMLVLRQGDEREPHWNDSAELILTSLIAFVCACETDQRYRNLRTVRRIVSSPTRFARAIKAMQQVEGFWNIVADHGRLCQWFVDRELGSVMTTVQRHTEWMDDPQVSNSLSTTTFDPSLLRTGRVSAYFVLPQELLATFAALMRTWIGCTLKITARAAAAESNPESNPVLFFIDEAGTLGNMQALQHAVTVMRGIGIRLWFFFQSLNQVHECYGQHATTILDNLGTQQYFGITSQETAEALSKRIGEQTILVDSESGGGSTSWPTGPGSNGSQSGNRTRNWGWSTSAMARLLYKPEEIRVLPEDQALILHRNNPVIQAKMLRYFDAPEFRKRGGDWGDGRQGGMGLPSFLAVAAAVLLMAAIIPVAEGVSYPEPQRPGFQVAAGGDPPAAPPYDIAPLRPTIVASPGTTAPLMSSGPIPGRQGQVENFSHPAPPPGFQAAAGGGPPAAPSYGLGPRRLLPPRPIPRRQRQVDRVGPWEFERFYIKIEPPPPSPPGPAKRSARGS